MEKIYADLNFLPISWQICWVNGKGIKLRSPHRDGGDFGISGIPESLAKHDATPGSTTASGNLHEIDSRSHV